MSAFLSGIASGFATRTVERNDQRREEYLKKQKNFFENVVKPRIEDYTKNAGKYEQEIKTAIANRDYLKSIGVPDDAQSVVIKASSNAKGEFDSSKAVDVWANLKKYYKPSEKKDLSKETPIEQQLPAEYTSQQAEQPAESSKSSVGNVLKDTFSYSGKQFGEKDQNSTLIEALKSSGIDPQDFSNYMKTRNASPESDPRLAGTSSGATFDVPQEAQRELENKIDALQNMFPNVSREKIVSFAADATKTLAAGDNVVQLDVLKGAGTAIMPIERTGSGVSRQKTIQELDTSFNTVDQVIRLGVKVRSTLAKNDQFALGALTKAAAGVTGVADIIGVVSGVPYFNKIAESFNQQEFGEYKSNAKLLGLQLGQMLNAWKGQTGKDERAKLNEALNLLESDTAGPAQQIGALFSIDNIAQTALVSNFYQRAFIEKLSSEEADKYVFTELANYYKERFRMKPEEAVELAKKVYSVNKRTIIGIDRFREMQELANQAEMEEDSQPTTDLVSKPFKVGQ